MPKRKERAGLWTKNWGFPAFRDISKNCRVENMFLCQNPYGERMAIVLRQNWHTGLAEDGAVIEIGCHFMDGAAMFGFASRKRAGMSVEPAVFR